MSLAQPIEMYVITPADLLATFLVGLFVLGLAIAGTWWAVRAPRVADDPEETVEIPRPRRSRRRPHTGIVHPSPSSQSADETVPICDLLGGGFRG